MVRCSKCGEGLDEGYQIRHGFVDGDEFIAEEDTAEYRCSRCIRATVRRRHPKILELQDWLDQQRDELLEETSSTSRSIR